MNYKNTFLKPLRKSFIVLFQALVIVCSFYSAFALRFDGLVPTFYEQFIKSLLPALIIIKLTVFGWMGLLSGWWKYVSLPDLVVIFKANIIASSGVLLYVVIFYRLGVMPRSVIILDCIICFLLICGFRALVRIARESYMFNHKKGGATLEHILIVGAGAGGQAIVREIRQSPHLKKIVIGYLDHDPDRHHLSFQGVPVLGDTDDLKTILEKTKVDEVIIAKPALCPKELRQIVSYCQKAKVRSKILPNIGDIINDSVSIQHVREVQLEDLLNRAPVTLDVKGIERYLFDKRVLVTGAGGSIGSEICRQIAKFRPASIVLLDNAETPLFHIENELNEKYSYINVIPSLTDIRDHRKINDVFNKYSPEVVFHAAAYKHVPMSELDIVTTVKNNVLGTSYLAEIAHKQKVKYFVMVSTDKAVNPTNAMGASKRAAEIFVQSLSRESQTNFVTVRFGNVLGSNGSVIPTFRKQIRRGGPVTVTHPDATRFFMTISEAVQLVLQAGSMGHGGEIFVLDMGEQVKILHLAEELIRLSGLVPYEDIDIAFTGLRPGEKMYEELLLDAEEVMPTSHEKIRIAKSTYCNMLQLRWKLESLYQSTIRIDQAKTLEVLTQIVPEYRQTSYSKRPLSRLPEWGGVSTQPTVLLQDKLH